MLKSWHERSMGVEGHLQMWPGEAYSPQEATEPAGKWDTEIRSFTYGTRPVCDEGKHQARHKLKSKLILAGRTICDDIDDPSLIYSRTYPN